MSLESQVGDLVAATNNLIATFSGKKAEIDKAVAAAVAAAPAMKRVFYVDQTTGDDKIGLGTQTSPYKTIQAAIDATPNVGRVDVYLLSDYVLDVHVMLNGRRVVIRGANGQRRLQLNEFVNNYDNARRMGSFWHSEGASLELIDLVISLPDGSANASVPVSAYYAVNFASGSTVPLIGQVKLKGVAFELRGPFVGWFSMNLPVIALQCEGTTIPSALNGVLIYGVAAGTKPETLPRVLTNLTSL
ncbi:hypothetical protein [Chromobacterium amazonense]|uniref:hypothetical protein n=1 Tax=Chromobacterium amazonense TaxID=1382803 RepID=UPI003F794C59